MIEGKFLPIMTALNDENNDSTIRIIPGIITEMIAIDGIVVAKVEF